MENLDKSPWEYVFENLNLHLDSRVGEIETRLEACSLELSQSKNMSYELRLKLSIEKWLHIYEELKMVADKSNIKLKPLKQIEYVNRREADLENKGSDIEVQRECEAGRKEDEPVTSR